MMSGKNRKNAKTKAKALLKPKSVYQEDSLVCLSRIQPILFGPLNSL
jgi:hypothetical protein